MRTARSHLHKKLNRRTPASEDPLTWLPTAEHEFDRRYGVDTSGLVWGLDLNTGSPSDRWNTAYYGIGPSVFHHVMAQVPVSLQCQATFIDLGCGKGRAVLLASEYPFVRTIGVEIAPQLHSIAMKNVAQYAAAHARQGEGRIASMNILLQDAGLYSFPPGPLVVYLYHPFCRPVLEQVVANLASAIAAEPRDVAVLYINHELHDVLDQAPFLEQVWSATVAMDESDRLADRVGSSAEDCTVYRAYTAPAVAS